MQEWQASKAHGALAKIIDAAVGGAPQLILRRDGRDGREVVVVSRYAFEANAPNLHDYLLTSGYAEDHDEFDDTMRKVRDGTFGRLSPRAGNLEE